jgi:hypothetical protein
MSPRKSKGLPGLAASLRLTLLAAASLLLFAATAAGQCSWPPPLKIPVISPTYQEEEAALEDRLPTPPPPSWENRTPLRAYVQTASGLAREAAARVRTAAPDVRRALPPASVFALQEQLRKYLETWPTPGATQGEEWPEYDGESEGDQEWRAAPQGADEMWSGTARGKSWPWAILRKLIKYEL